MIIRDRLTCCQRLPSPLWQHLASAWLYGQQLWPSLACNFLAFWFHLLVYELHSFFFWFTSLLFPSFVLRMANFWEPFLPSFTYPPHTLVNRPTENADVKIVAVDLQLMAPIPGVVQIHGDITKVNFFFNHLNGQLLIPNLFRFTQFWPFWPNLFDLLNFYFI